MSKFMSDEKLANWFAYHLPTSAKVAEAHQIIRTRYQALALEMNGLLPEGPDKTSALRAIYDAMMKANSVIATTQQVYSE